jgi:hypothetical protein
MSQPYYNPNDPNQPAYYPQGGQPPTGYTRVEPQKQQKAGDKYKGSGKKSGKSNKNPRGSSPWANLGVWIIGLGLPVLLVYFGIQKLMVEDTVVEMNPHPPVQLSDEQKKTFVTWSEEVATGLREGKQDELQRLVAWRGVQYRVIKPMQLTLGETVKMRDIIKAEWESDIPGLFRQLGGGDLVRIPAQFVKFRERDGYPTALIRIMPTEEDVRYFDLLVVPVQEDEKGAPVERLKIVDIYDCNRGSYASEMVRQESIVQFPTNEEDNLAWRSIYGENRTGPEVLTIKNILLKEALNNVAILTDLEEIPADLQGTRWSYSLRIHAYQKMMADAVTASDLEKFKITLNNAPAADSGSLVTGVMLALVEKRLGNEAAVEPALLKAHQEIGGDAYLKVLIGRKRLAAGDVAGAETMANEARSENRTLSELVPFKLDIEAKRKAK